MHNGIIISTQSPIEGNTWPRSGGTAFALRQVTGLPVIKMHRDGEAREEEQTELKKITDGGIVFITGHGRSGGASFSGMYETTGLGESSVIHNWQLSAYRDLIINNSSLKEGDKLTLVLWACKAGAGHQHSTAAQLMKLFLDKGISTRIIASTQNLQRFDGAFAKDEIPGLKIRFRTGPNSISIFDSCMDTEKKGFKEYLCNGPLFFSSEGIELNNVHFNMICQNPNYIDSIDSPELASVFLEKNQRRVIFHRSNVSLPEKKHFAMTYLHSDGVAKTEFFYLDETNQLTCCDQSGSILYTCDIDSCCITLLHTLSQRKSVQDLCDEYRNSPYYKGFSADKAEQWFFNNPEEDMMIRPSSIDFPNAVATFTFSMRGDPHRRYIIHPCSGLQRVFQNGERGAFIPVSYSADMALFLKSSLISTKPKASPIAPVSFSQTFFTPSSSSSLSLSSSARFLPTSRPSSSSSTSSSKMQEDLLPVFPYIAEICSSPYYIESIFSTVQAVNHMKSQKTNIILYPIDRRLNNFIMAYMHPDGRVTETHFAVDNNKLICHNVCGMPQYTCDIEQSCMDVLIRLAQRKTANNLCKEYRVSPFYHDEITAENVTDWFTSNPGEHFVMHPSSYSISTSNLMLRLDAYGCFSISQLDSQNQVCSRRYMIHFHGGLQQIHDDNSLGSFIPVPEGQEIGLFLKDFFMSTLQKTGQVSQPSSSSVDVAPSSNPHAIFSPISNDKKMSKALKRTMKQLDQNSTQFMASLSEEAKQLFFSQLIDPDLSTSELRSLAVRWLVSLCENKFSECTDGEKQLALNLASAYYYTMTVNESDFADTLEFIKYKYPSPKILAC